MVPGQKHCGFGGSLSMAGPHLPPHECEVLPLLLQTGQTFSTWFHSTCFCLVYSVCLTLAMKVPRGVLLAESSLGFLDPLFGWISLLQAQYVCLLCLGVEVPHHLQVMAFLARKSSWTPWAEMHSASLVPQICCSFKPQEVLQRQYQMVFGAQGISSILRPMNPHSEVSCVWWSSFNLSS